MKTMIDVEIRCPFCGKTYSVSVPERGFLAWEAGELIQRAMPEVDATTRECLISRVCPNCQTSIFGVYPEDEDEDVEGDCLDLTAGDSDLWGEEVCEDYDDCDCEEGFDPYCGCFTYDC